MAAKGSNKRTRAAEAEFTPPPELSPEEQERERLALGGTAAPPPVEEEEEAAPAPKKVAKANKASVPLTPLINISNSAGRLRQCREADFPFYARQGYVREE